MYKGVGPTVVKQGSNQAIRFFVMESLRVVYTGGDLSIPVPYYVVALFGAIAGIHEIFSKKIFTYETHKNRHQTLSILESRRRQCAGQHPHRRGQDPDAERGPHLQPRVCPPAGGERGAPRLLQGLSAPPQQSLPRGRPRLHHLRHCPELLPEDLALLIE